MNIGGAGLEMIHVMIIDDPHNLYLVLGLAVELNI